ncbi:XdhC family protein [Amycolatopsis sp. MtRt-6]|uniref:XdhC family protein n=1 Tax=Amycolatopsis sp. MtRt-6 TaxID=2792782 RepID=UPI001A8C11EC|nr:XdhC family protein [Amycolatopsis sp. MtRt-6]
MSETCDVAHGTAPADPGVRTLVAVFASPVSRFLLKFAKDLGYHVALYEPDPARVTDVPEGFDADTVLPPLDAATDVVVTDHHRPELGAVLKAALEGEPRWVGVLGNPRHAGPHVAALRGLGVPDADIARVHRPVGLNIGSRTPPEIALATLAGLLADRNNRPGGFDFTP